MLQKENGVWRSRLNLNRSIIHTRLKKSSCKTKISFKILFLNVLILQDDLLQTHVCGKYLWKPHDKVKSKGQPTIQ